MSPVTHGQLGWLLANIAPLNRKERSAIFLAGLFPDLDGLGLLVSLPAYIAYHHVVLHNLMTGLIFALAVFALTRRRLVTSLLALLSFHIHLGADLLGSGPNWGIQYLRPFAAHEWLVAFQWNLASWQNFAVTLMALGLCFLVALKRGRTPLEFISPKLDARVIEVIKGWFGKP